MSGISIAALTLRERRRRVLGLVAFAGLFLAAGVTASLFARDEHGHVNIDQLFVVGGFPLVSGLLLVGWFIGRYPLIAALVLLAGIFSHDHANGFTRIYSVRPTSLLRIYGVRFAILGAVAFLLSALLMPIFDLIMLGTWAGPATFILILANLLVYGGLVALLSVWIRADVWVAVGLAIFAIIWDALRRADALLVPNGLADFMSFILPPQAALLQLEEAFGNLQPIPWDAFAYAAIYGVALLALAGVGLLRRET